MVGIRAHDLSTDHFLGRAIGNGHRVIAHDIALVLDVYDLAKVRQDRFAGSERHPVRELEIAFGIARIHRADRLSREIHAFMGLLVPAGRHLVRLEFAPTSWKLGLGMGALSLVIGASVVALLALVARRQPSSPRPARRNRTP